MPRVLITGSSGFIGSRVAIQAKQAGHDVIATARAPSETLVRELGMPVVRLDVLEPISPINGIEGIDLIVHCATANDIVSRDFEAGMALSVHGTRNVLEFAVKHKIQRVIFVSTLQVYGTELVGEIREDTPSCCQSPYGLNHYFGEELCRMYSRVNGIDLVLLRPANVYGVPDVSATNRDTLVPMCFVKEAVDTGTITLRSSGLQHRNFISTQEVAEACLHLLGDFPLGCEVINLGSNWQSSIREIAEMTALVYQRLYKKQLRINIMSEEPRVSNRFSIQSRIEHVRPSVEESRALMSNVITQLFNHSIHHEELSDANN